MQHPLPQPDHLAGHGDFPGGIHRQMQHVRPLQRVTLLHPQSQRVLAGQLQPAAMPDKAEPVRQLAYHLYTLCERKKWAEDARAYNELITAWHAVLEASREEGPRGEQLGFEA